jgi:hypothetical protein
VAFPTGWTKRSAITIPAAQVGSGGVTSFTVLLTEANLPAGLFTDARSDGGDIRFSTDSAGASQLAVDVISYSAGGTALLRVGPVSLSSVSANTLYLWYGNASATMPLASDTYGQYAAYSGWAGYWPLESDYNDRTSNARHGTAVSAPVVATGKVGSGRTMDGNDGITCTTANLGIGNALTLRAWVNVNGTLSSAVGVIEKDQAGGLSARSLIWRVNPSGMLEFVTIRTGGAVDVNITGATDLRGAGWKFVAARFDSTNGGKQFVNAVANGTTQASTNTINEAGAPLTLGYSGRGPAEFFMGTADEYAVDVASRSEAWLTTEFNQTNAPASFASAGTPVSVGGGSTAYRKHALTPGVGPLGVGSGISF